MVGRRAFLGGLAGIFAAGMAPSVAGSGVLMPVRKIIAPPAVVVARSTQFVVTNVGTTTFYLHGLTYGDSLELRAPGHGMAPGDVVVLHGFEVAPVGKSFTMKAHPVTGAHK